MLEIGRKYHALHLKPYVGFTVVTGGIELPQKRAVRGKWYPAAKMAVET